MDSTRPAQSSPPSLEDLARRTARLLLLPYIVHYVSSSPTTEPSTREVAVIVNRRTGSLTMLDGDVDVEALLRGGKDGRVPASKESIDSIPLVKVAEEGLDCAICLSEFEVGEEAKQMPCKHRYHATCINKWLGIQGSCPTCRLRMPEGRGEKKKEGDGDNGHGGAGESTEDEDEDDNSDDEEEEDGDGDGEGEGEGERVGEQEQEQEEEEEEEGGLYLGRIPSFVFHIYFSGRRQTRTDSGLESGEADESDEDN